MSHVPRPHIGEVISQAMANHSWSSEEIAKYFRIDIEEVMRWMDGTQKPKRDHCKLLANILQIDFGNIWYADTKIEVCNGS